MIKEPTPLGSSVVVQYKLTDYIDGKPKPVDTVICERLSQSRMRSQSQRITDAPRLALLDGNHLGSVNPVCPRCGSSDYNRDGFYKRNPKFGGFGEVSLYMQRYECKKCGKGYSTRMEEIVEGKHQYARIFKKMVNAVAMIMKHSGRRIKLLFLALFGISPSHQTIESWFACDIPEVGHSGYYAFDEQYVRLKGKRAYRLTLFDLVLNVPLAEDVSPALNADVVKAFLEKHLKGKPVYGMVTDDRKFYRDTVGKYRALHQLCAFHFLKKVREDADYYFQGRSLSESDKIRIALAVSCIHEVFRSSTREEFEEKLIHVADTMDVLPSRMKKQVKKLVRDVDLYTTSFSDPWIPKTTGRLENYYRQTDPEKMKRQYKTPQGLTRALSLKAVFWIVRNGFITEEDSLTLAQEYLSSKYDRDNIRKVFSGKKKHVLKYWLGDPTT